MKYDYLKDIEQLSGLYNTLKNSLSDVPYSDCIKHGKNLESLVRYVYSVRFPKYKAASTELIKLIKDKNFKNFLGNTDYYNKLHFIYVAANNAAYDHDIDRETAELSLESLKDLTYHIFSKIISFNEEDIQKYKYVFPSNINISEAKTRELYIDVNLKNAHYNINKFKDNLGHGRPSANCVCVEIEVHNLPNQDVGFIDYVIYNKVGLPIAVIEAKRTSKSEEEGAQQARDYADALKKELKLKYRPIIYYTNGYTIKIQDRLGYPAREVGNFASMDDLELMIKRQMPGDTDARKAIINKKVDTNIINRSKLVEAINSMVDSMNSTGGMRRKGLLVLPCGVGKTRTAVALCKILLENDWVQNILFLADRNNLVTNALKPFEQYIDGVVSDISAENPDRDINARVCICTYNSMLNFINKPNKEFSVGHFDLIIVDEAHRSLFNVYRSIFEYFDSFLIGLTATPSKALDRSTYEILDLPVDQPTFEVKFEEAVNLKYLVSYKAFDKTSALLKEGLKYSDLSQKEKEEYEEIFGEANEDIPASAFSRTISNSGILYNEKTIDEMFEDLFNCGLRVDNGNKIGKTLIFARDHNHAEKIAERFKIRYPNLGDDFCQVIDNKINKNKTRQDNFAKKDSNPQIVVSVDMMDTGVDIPEILNLVFFKKILSRIKFDQMIGRGTRTCANLKCITPPRDYFEGRIKDDTRIEYLDKQGFYIFDYCDNFNYFELNPEGNDSSVTLNLNQKIYSLKLDMIYLLQDIKYQEIDEFKNYYNSLKNVIVEKISKLDKNRIDVHKKLSYVDKYNNLDAFKHISDKNVYEIKTNLLRLIDQDTNDDTCSKSLDYRLSIIQLSRLDTRIDSSKQQVQLMNTAKALLKKASIQDIFNKKDILKEISDESYYHNLDFFKLEKLKTDIGPLIKYLKGEEELLFITNFNDDIDTKDIDIKYNFDDFKNYREKIVSYIQKNLDSLGSVNKIINLETLEETDLDELKTILEKFKNPESNDELFDNTQELIIFIRKAIGIDRELINEKCQNFVDKDNLTKEQKQLFNLIIDFAIRNGNVTGEDLINLQPFCDFEFGIIFEDNLEPVLNLIKLFNEALNVVINIC